MEEPTPRQPFNLALAIGLGLPLLMIVVVAALLYLPRLSEAPEPRFSFVYTAAKRGEAQRYTVENERLSVVPLAEGESEEPRPLIYYHDVKTNQSRLLDPATAQALTLDASARAPDGYHIEHGRRPGWYPFDSGRDYRRRFLVNDNHAIELSLELDHSSAYYYANFAFMGWVIEE